MKAKKLIKELRKIIKEQDRDIEISILVDNYIVNLERVTYNPKYGGDGIILE